MSSASSPGFAFGRRVRGWRNDQERQELSRLARNRTFFRVKGVDEKPALNHLAGLEQARRLRRFIPLWSV